MLSIGKLAKSFGLSRSTLLYYDRKGLLSPSGRSAANYRLYNEADVVRLQQIVRYRDAGLPLSAIADILDSPDNHSTDVLESRLQSLNTEISRLRQQQRLILKLVGKDSLLRSARIMSKDQWVSLLRAAGMNDAAMHQWHIEFEHDLPEMHQDFLESLGIAKQEIQRIREWSKTKSQLKEA